MQKLTQSQGDAILDVVDQCHAVIAAYAQSEAGSRDRKANKKAADGEAVAKATDATYQRAIGRLVDLYAAAESLAVDTSVIDGVVQKTLPAAIWEAFKPPVPAA